MHSQSKDILQNIQLPNLTEMEGWGSAVERRIIVKPLKEGRNTRFS